MKVDCVERKVRKVFPRPWVGPSNSERRREGEHLLRTAKGEHHYHDLCHHQVTEDSYQRK